MSFPFGQPKDGFGHTGGPNAYQASPAYGTGDATAQYVPGTVMHYSNTVLNAMGACVYGKFDESGVTSIVRQPVTLVDGAGAEHFEFTSDNSDNLKGPFAISCGVVTDNYYAWWWCWGAPPLFYTDATTYYHSGTILTDGSIAAGEPFYFLADSTIVVYVWGTTVSMPMGTSRLADTSTAIAVEELQLLGSGLK